MAEVIRAVLFDWDGTLLDSAEAGLRTYERLFASYGIGFDRGRFAETYSPNWHLTYEKVGLPRDKWDEADSAWLEIYACEECDLVDGAREALALLETAGVRTGLVTSGTGSRVRRELARLGLDFPAIVCAEDVGNRKPHPDALLAGLAKLEVVPAQAAYVGDTPEDVEMARAAGVFSVGVPGGFPTHNAVRAASPDLHAEDLLNAIRSLLAI